MGIIDKNGKALGPAGQDVYWKSVLPGYEGQSSSFAIPGASGSYAGDKSPRFRDQGQELSGPDHWFGAAQGDRHLLHSMTDGMSEEDAYKTARLIDTGHLDDMSYGRAMRKLGGLKHPESYRDTTKGPAPKIAAPQAVGPRPWSPFPDAVEY